MKERIGEAIQHLLGEDQNPAAVERICFQVRDILTSEETIDYVAVQRKLVANPTPDAVVLTNRRFILYRPKLFGRVEFEDHPWRDLTDVHLEEGVIGSTLRFRMMDGSTSAVNHLPRSQARRLYGVAQEKEERVREEQRRRQLEEKRAVSGMLILQGGGTGNDSPGSPPPADPVESLKRLKEMLEADLISPGEYEAKRVEIISRM